MGELYSQRIFSRIFDNFKMIKFIGSDLRWQNKIDKIQNQQDLEIEGILITKLDNRTTVGYDIIEKVKFLFPNKIFKTIITSS